MGQYQFQIHIRSSTANRPVPRSATSRVDSLQVLRSYSSRVVLCGTDIDSETDKSVA